MRKVLPIAVAAVLLIPGCTTQQQPPAPAPLPDGRDLSERPLEVLELPQS